MLVPNRHGSSNSYRYGFQGQEKDDEIKGEGNSLNYTFRMHDPRVGRFFAIDPLTHKYPFYSPYQFSGNRVIDMVELEGLEPALAGNREGQSEWALGNTPDHEIFSMFRQLAGAKTWYWHGGTQTTAFGWYSHDDYKEIIMPFALEVAGAKGGHIGLTWQEAGNLLNQGLAKELIKPISSDLKDFLSRTFDGGDGNFFGIDGAKYYNGIVVDAIANVGAGRMRTINSQKYSSASGLCTPIDELSPVFLGTGVLFRLTVGPKMGIGYRAISAEYAESTLANGFFRSGAPGRLGGDGIYFNSSAEGALSEFYYHNPAGTPALFQVRYPLSKPLLIKPPSGYFDVLPFTQDANILTAPSLRAPNTMNFLIRSGEKVGKQIR